MLTGTIINALAILAGSAVGLGIHALAGRFSAVLGAKGIRLGERLQTIMMQGISLCVLYVGVTGSLKGQNTLVAILSMVAGSILGELPDLDARMGRLGQWVQDKLSHILKAGGNSVADGFVTASLVFCVGAMAIVGALENGLTGNFDTLKAKAVLDGVSAIVFASSLGLGVALSAGAVFLYQGIIALAAGALSPLLGQTGYEGATDGQKSAYLTYVRTLLSLVGQSEADAAAQADALWDADAKLAAASYSNQELGDVDKTYNLYTMAQLKALFPNVDLDQMFQRTGLTQTNQILVMDPGCLQACAELFDAAKTPNALELLKAYARLNLANGLGGLLNQEFTDASNAFNLAYFGQDLPPRQSRHRCACPVAFPACRPLSYYE